MANPLVTSEQAANISSDYGIDASKAVGLPQSQLAMSYLSLDPNVVSEYANNSGQNNNDSTLSDLIKNGYLDWGSDVNGNKQLAAGGVLQDAINAQNAKLKPGGNTIVSGPAVNLFGGADATVGATHPTQMSQQFQDYQKLMSSALSSGEVHSLNPGITGNYSGAVDPVTGLQNFDITGYHPDIKMNSKFTAMQGPLLSSLIMAPLGATMAAGMGQGLGSLGSSLFSQLGQSALNGGKFNFNPMQLLGMIAPNLGIPPDVMKYIQMGLGAVGSLSGGKPDLTKLASQYGPSLVKSLLSNFGG